VDDLQAEHVVAEFYQYPVLQLVTAVTVYAVLKHTFAFVLHAIHLLLSKTYPLLHSLTSVADLHDLTYVNTSEVHAVHVLGLALESK